MEQTAEEFLKERAGDATPEDMHKILDKVPDTKPEPGDEID